MGSWKRKASGAIDIYAAFLLLLSGARLMSVYGALPENIGDYGISIIKVSRSGKGILIAAYGISLILFFAISAYGRMIHNNGSAILAGKLLAASVLPLVNERTINTIYGASGIQAYLEGFLGWTAIAVLAAFLAASIFRMYFRKK